MNTISMDTHDIIFSFLRPDEYRSLNKYHYEKSKEKIAWASAVIKRSIVSYYTQIKTINKPIKVKIGNSNYSFYKLINSSPVYSKIYVKKFYPRKLISGALVFYISNVNRYDYELEDKDLIKMLVFTIFYMKESSLHKLNEVLRILPKKNYTNLYKCFVKYKVLNSKAPFLNYR